MDEQQGVSASHHDSQLTAAKTVGGKGEEMVDLCVVVEDLKGELLRQKIIFDSELRRQREVFQERLEWSTKELEKRESECRNLRASVSILGERLERIEKNLLPQRNGLTSRSVSPTTSTGISQQQPSGSTAGGANRQPSPSRVIAAAPKTVGALRSRTPQPATANKTVADAQPATTSTAVHSRQVSPYRRTASANARSQTATAVAATNASTKPVGVVGVRHFGRMNSYGNQQQQQVQPTTSRNNGAPTIRPTPSSRNYLNTGARPRLSTGSTGSSSSNVQQPAAAAGGGTSTTTTPRSSVGGTASTSTTTQPPPRVSKLNIPLRKATPTRR